MASFLVEPDDRIVWANAAALRLHGARRLADLGATAGAYAERFALTYRDGEPLSRRPIR